MSRTIKSIHNSIYNNLRYSFSQTITKDLNIKNSTHRWPMYYVDDKYIVDRLSNNVFESIKVFLD
jgi:hypothetical protein